MATDFLAPVRLGIRITVGVLRFEARILEECLDLLSPRQVDTDDWVPADARRPVPSEPPVATVEPEPSPEPPMDVGPVPDVEPTPMGEEESPVHLDDEPELVAESSDPGAEEGPGPELHVQEPWAGYRQMKAAEIRDRIAVADAAELAVVQLYESGDRSRRTVLDAVERRSKELANAPR